MPDPQREESHGFSRAEDVNDFVASASQIKKYSKCGLQYKFSYIDDYDEAKKSEGYLELGTAVHEILENYLDPDVPHPMTVDKEDAGDIGEYLLEEYYKVNDEVPEGLDSRGEDAIEGAARFLSKTSDVPIKAVEKKAFFDYGDGPSAQRMIGYMDVVTDSGEIWDWKTGKDFRTHDDQIQAGVYMKAYEDLYGHLPEQVKFVYVLKGELQKFSPDGDAIGEATKYLGQLKRGRIKGEYPAMPTESNCKWCSYEWMCDSSPVGFGQLSWEDWQ